MSDPFVLLNFADNPIVWAILLLTLFCYILQFGFLLEAATDSWKSRLQIWLKVLPVLLSALPLLGLLGTIGGLLDTFGSMATSSGLEQQTLLGSGIADALITTQLGLVLVIPGLLMLTGLKYRYREASAA